MDPRRWGPLGAIAEAAYHNNQVCFLDPNCEQERLGVEIGLLIRPGTWVRAEQGCLERGS